MSDKRYSTDELIREMVEAHLQAVPVSAEIGKAIAAKLRAADALKEAGERVALAVSVYADPNDARAFKDAIAAYDEA